MDITATMQPSLLFFKSWDWNGIVDAVLLGMHFFCRRIPGMNRQKTVLVTLMFAGLATSTVLAQSGGADIYKSKCTMCHAADGTANSPAGKAMKTPSFKDPAVMKMSSAELPGS